MMWIEASQYKIENGKERCEAIFAFSVLPFAPKEWSELRWGFNVGALLDEALDRLKFFVESQYAVDVEPGADPAGCRTLSLRCLAVQGHALQLSLLGKICAPDEEQARREALMYAREVESTFPMDFMLVARKTRDAFLQAAGWDLFSDAQFAVSQIWRGKVDLPVEHGVRPLTGFWQTSPHASEQIWRALASMPQPSLLNITLRPMALADGDRKFLETIRQNLNTGKEGSLHVSILQTNLAWAEAYFKRRLTPFKKFFHLQVSLLVKDGFDDGLARSIGTAFTRDAPDQLLTGYWVVHPESDEQAQMWREKIYHLELIPMPFRLDDFADIEEVFSVFRLPYLHSEITPLYSLFFKKSGDD